MNKQEIKLVEKLVKASEDASTYQEKYWSCLDKFRVLEDQHKELCKDYSELKSIITQLYAETDLMKLELTSCKTAYKMKVEEFEELEKNFN